MAVLTTSEFLLSEIGVQEGLQGQGCFITVHIKPLLNFDLLGWRHLFPAKEHSNTGYKLGENVVPFQWISMQLVELRNLCPAELGSFKELLFTLQSTLSFSDVFKLYLIHTVFICIYIYTYIWRERDVRTYIGCFEAQGSHKPLHLQWTKNQIKSTKLGLELLDSKTLELLRLPKLSRLKACLTKEKHRFLSFQP